MKRLSELPRDDRVIDRAQHLLAAVEPLVPSRVQRERVKRALDQRRAERTLRTLVSRPRVLWLAAALSLAGTTLAAAQSGALRALLASVSVAIEQRAEPARAPRKLPASVRHEAPLQLAPPASELLVLEESAPKQIAARQPQRTHGAPTRSAYNELVRSAVKALRRDGDAALAARLLEEAQAKNPHGALAEEVMALRVEAAAALGDARVGAYARQYLARYPDGRYRNQVDQAVGKAPVP